jgi:DNA-binding helix-hairpin-helix protein with protein kinase domain
MHKYYNVAKMVEPKRAALAGANASLQMTLKALADAKVELQEVNDQISSMEVKFDAMVAKEAQLEAKTSECSQRLSRALATDENDAMIALFLEEKSAANEQPIQEALAVDKVTFDAVEAELAAVKQAADVLTATSIATVAF